MLRTLTTRGRDFGDLDDLVRAALAGDPDVTEVVTQAMRHLGRGLANLVNITNPSHLVIGGELHALGPMLLDPLREELLRLSFAARLSGISLSTASLGRRSSLYGALAMVLTQPPRFVDGASLFG